MVQWLGLHTSITGGIGAQSLVDELRSLKLCSMAKREKKKLNGHMWLQVAVLDSS